MSGWVIIWEGMSFNSKGVEPGTYLNELTVIADCEKLNANTLSDRRYKVVPVNSDEHRAAITHKFSWRK